MTEIKSACDDATEAQRLAAKRAEAGNLSQQLINGARREGVDLYTKTLLLHASGLIDEQIIAFHQTRVALSCTQADIDMARGDRELDGHNMPCLMCGEPCNSLAGNPSLWPLRLGNNGWHHTGCVNKALDELVRLTAPPSADALQDVCGVVHAWFRAAPERTISPQNAAGELYQALAIHVEQAAAAERTKVIKECARECDLAAQGAGARDGKLTTLSPAHECARRIRALAERIASEATTP